MKTIKEFIKAYSDLPKSDSTFVYEDNQGKKYNSVEDAYKAGKQVVIKNTKDSALEDLKAVGVESKSDEQKLVDLISFLYGKEAKKEKGKKGIKTYSEEDKKAILHDWEEAYDQGTSMAEFSREKGVGYQTFFKWVKEAKGK